eukprot:TRINITY_DN121392_c0_g1_i1.p1 TRINITY_DN121392_c0_g1~~TRINITY_DN121392_c0_g1_i1.p1  ORF type:complete len:833 (-),score=145.66 TRINITY_DN121392_c0_g1_i1:196-2694(-)
MSQDSATRFPIAVDKLRWSHSSVFDHFGYENGLPGKSVFELVVELLLGSCRLEDIPPLRVMQKDNQLYSLSNRRLFAFKKYQEVLRKLKPDLPPVSVTVTLNPLGSGSDWCFTTLNQGRSVELMRPFQVNYRQSFKPNGKPDSMLQTIPLAAVAGPAEDDRNWAVGSPQPQPTSALEIEDRRDLPATATRSSPAVPPGLFEKTPEIPPTRSLAVAVPSPSPVTSAPSSTMPLIVPSEPELVPVAAIPVLWPQQPARKLLALHCEDRSAEVFQCANELVNIAIGFSKLDEENITDERILHDIRSLGPPWNHGNNWYILGTVTEGMHRGLQVIGVGSNQIKRQRAVRLAVAVAVATGRDVDFGAYQRYRSLETLLERASFCLHGDRSVTRLSNDRVSQPESEPTPWPTRRSDPAPAAAVSSAQYPSSTPLLPSTCHPSSSSSADPWGSYKGLGFHSQASESRQDVHSAEEVYSRKTLLLARRQLSQWRRRTNQLGFRAVPIVVTSKAYRAEGLGYLSFEAGRIIYVLSAERLPGEETDKYAFYMWGVPQPCEDVASRLGGLYLDAQTGGWYPTFCVSNDFSNHADDDAEHNDAEAGSQTAARDMPQDERHALLARGPDEEDVWVNRVNQPPAVSDDSSESEASSDPEEEDGPDWAYQDDKHSSSESHSGDDDADFRLQESHSSAASPAHTPEQTSNYPFLVDHPHLIAKVFENRPFGLKAFSGAPGYFVHEVSAGKPAAQGGVRSGWRVAAIGRTYCGEKERSTEDIKELLSSERTPARVFFDATHMFCTICKEVLPETTFSRKMRTKPVDKWKCQSCVPIYLETKMEHDRRSR